MPSRLKQRNEIQLSYEAIYRLGHCANYSQQDKTKWNTVFVPDTSFEIGVWESVVVKSPVKKKRKGIVKEPIDNENIDYSSHLTPTIENMKQPVQSAPKSEAKDVVPYFNIYQQKKPDCFCYVCLIRYNITPHFPKRMIMVTKKVPVSKLFQVSNATERLFLRMMRAMTTHRIQRPLGNPIDYETILEFFEDYCRPEVVDIAVVLNDQLIEIVREKNFKKMRKLHEVFKSLVFASVSRILYRTLSERVPEDELKDKAFWYIKDIKKFDPLNFLEMNPESDRNLEKNYIKLY